MTDFVPPIGFPENPAPASWIEQHQRQRCDGRSALSTFQGMLFDEVLVPQSALDASDPAILVRASLDFADAALTRAYFLPGEFALEALHGLHAYTYVEEAGVGGQRHYLALTSGDDIARRAAAAGLKSMVADPYYELLRETLSWTVSDARALRRRLSRENFRSLDAAYRDLDKRFAALAQAEPLGARHKMWLKSLRKLRVVADRDWAPALRSLEGRNPLAARRRAELERARSQRRSNDPVFQAAASLCESAGLRLDHMGAGDAMALRAAWPKGPDRRAFVFPLRTDRGALVAAFVLGGVLSGAKAILIEAGAEAPTAEQPAGKDLIEAAEASIQS